MFLFMTSPLYIYSTALFYCCPNLPTFRLMFDPYAKIVYDYMGGIEDITKTKVCMYLFEAMVSYIAFSTQQFELFLTRSFT